MEIRDLGPPPAVRWIAQRLEDAGFQAWAVGGAVRDALLGDIPEDWDLTTSARPRQVQKLFKRTVPVGIDHGTVGVLAKDGRMYEVTTFRRDVETFGRRARVAFADSLEEDLDRRDFTINALAWHPLTGELRDPHGGAADLQARRLRTVGDASERFAEDRLRVLRALRFAGRFGMRVEPETWRSVKASAGLLGDLSPERVREELYKVLTAAGEPSRALHLYERSGVLAALYPELQACVGYPHASTGGDLWTFALAAVDAASRRRLVVRLAALLHGIGLPGTVSQPGVEPSDESSPGDVGGSLAWALMRRLRASNAHADAVAHLVAQHRSFPVAAANDGDLRRWLQRVGLDHHVDALRLAMALAAARGAAARAELLPTVRRIRAVVRGRPPLTLNDLAIGGSDLRAAGIPPGPRYGEILRTLLDRVVADPSLNTPERLLELIPSED